MVAVADSVVPGTVTVTTVGTTRAQIHGCSCAPEKIGPPREWLVMVSRADVLPGGRFDVGAGSTTACTSFGPSASPVSRPEKRPSGRTANALVTSWPLSVTRTLLGATSPGSTTSTRASPPEMRSARFDSTAIRSAS